MSSFARKRWRKARRSALASAKARGCRCNPRVEPVHGAVCLTHEAGCPLLDSIPPHPLGGRVGVTMIFPNEEAR
jgi:hypothetical protein